MKYPSGMSCKHVPVNATDLLQHNDLFWNILCSLSLKTETDKHACHNHFNNNNRHYFFTFSDKQWDTEESNEEHRKHKASFVRPSEAAKHSQIRRNRDGTKKILWTMRRWSREKIRRNQSGLRRDSVHSQQNQSLRISSFVKAPKITDWGRPWEWRGGGNQSI